MEVNVFVVVNRDGSVIDVHLSREVLEPLENADRGRRIIPAVVTYNSATREATDRSSSTLRSV